MISHDNKNMRSYLSKVKALGPAGNGTDIWIKQRLTALALVFLSFWFVSLVIKITASTKSELYLVAGSPFSTILLLMFVGVGLYHGKIGMKEIIEDYVHSHFIKNTIIILLNFFTIFTALTGFCAILIFHFSMFKLG